MPDWSIRVDDDGARRALKLFETALSDLRPFWPLVVILQRGWWKQQFDSEGGFAGARWAPLSAAYALTKRSGRGILVDTGQMRDAADSPQRRATPHTLTLTINDAGPAHGPVLQYHQFGTDRMPARPLVFGDPLPATAQIELDQAAEKYVDELLRVLR